MENQVLPKWLVNWLGAALLLLVSLYGVGKVSDLYQIFSNKNPKNTLSVSAEGKVKAVPDLATVTLGLITQGATAAEVQDQNSQKINRVIEFVKQQGINKDDIATSYFNIYPQQDYKDGRGTIIGYQANQTVTIKVHGVDKGTQGLGKIIDGATNNGANEVTGVSLSFNNPDNLRQQARQQAIEKAKDKAAELAKVSGLKLGRVVSVSESGGPVPVPYYADMAMGRGGGGGGLGLVAPNIEPGSQEITATITVVFEVK